jgi:Tol biopolymer transport system component
MPRTGKTRVLAFLAALLPAVAAAQYFGGNKVRYETPEFRVLPTEHFDIHTYAEEDAAAATAAVLAERWNARLTQLFGHPLSTRQPLVLYAGHPQFRQTNATPGEIGEGTGGFTTMFKRRIVMPLAGPLRESDHVLGHELVHAFQFDLMQTAPPSERARGNAGARMPLWFIEGMAEYLSLGSVDAQTAMWLRDAVARDKLPPIERLDSPRYFPYRWGHAFWAYVAGRYGDVAVAHLMRAVIKNGDLRKSVKDVLRIEVKQLSDDWHAALRAELGPGVAAARAPEGYGRKVLAAKRGRAEINVSPSLSPDGRHVLFYSPRELYSIELYVADAETGEVLRRLTKSAIDPHLDSLEFLSSSGAWSPDGRRVAVGNVSTGRPMLTILDAETGDTLDEQRFEDLVEVIHPAWSPDGRTIAFAANAGGFMQLYRYDLSTRERRPLTREPYSALQPAWSPDGKQIAFVTDRFGSDPARLVVGPYRLALLDVATGAIRPLPAIDKDAGSKHINPQWSPDGKSIYFLSDARGASNLYRLDVARGSIEQLTDVKTGITGITSLSPALSVAAQSGRVAASVFDGGLYHVFVFDRLDPQPVAKTPETPPNQLPPRERVDPQVDLLVSAPLVAPDEVATRERQPYEWHISPDYAASPNVQVGATSSGLVGGGIALFWSDMLGDHNLMTLLQAGGTSETIGRNTAAVVAYENRKDRWQWGGAIGQVPSYAAYYATDFGTYNGESARVDAIVRQWQINREVDGTLAYPFTRADRVEFSAGYRHIGYEIDAYEEIRSTNTGQLLAAGFVDLPAPESISLYPYGTALVHDNSVFGGTAPLAGSRYRLELGGVAGDLAYFTPLLDLRQYALPLPFLSVGARALHYGRYGADAEDPRLGDVYIGYPTLVRGYEPDSFEFAECDPAAAPACPVFDQLVGSRIAVANVEARVPLFGGRALVRSPAVPPIDFGVFYDTGVAWNDASGARFLGNGDRDFVSSYGATLRVGFGGVLVLQWNYAHPIDRPTRDWVWSFWIAPGF